MEAFMKQTTIKSLLLALILGSISQGTLQAMENNQINAQEEQDLQQAIELSLAEYETQQVIRNNNNHSWLSINLTHEQAINEFALYVPKLENHYLLVKVENITQADKIA